MDKSLTIFIVGTTAVGKTKLSIQLGKLLGGEIISCDSKQLYKHANILTAKVTKKQIQTINHYMVDCLNLNEITYNRNKYFTQAMKCMETIRNKGKIPIIVGGTNYYLETLLYDIDFEEKKTVIQKNQNIKYKEELSNLNALSLAQKYTILKDIDPKMAEKLHRNDQARITSFLKRYFETGVQPSQNYKPYINTLRNQNSILFWIRNPNKNEQNNLIKKRVQQMLNDQGIMQILSIWAYTKNNNLKQSSILESIGYKQFQEFYQSVKQQITTEKTQYEQIYTDIKQNYQKFNIKKDILHKCSQILIKNTKDYSRRQITWIKNRIFQTQHSSNFFILELIGQGNIYERFQNSVKNKSLQIIQNIQNQGFGSIKEKIESFRNKHQSFEDWKKQYCQFCNHEANGTHEWQQHLKSRKHTLNIKKKQKKQRYPQNNYIPIENQKQKNINNIKQQQNNNKQQQSNKNKQAIQKDNKFDQQQIK